MNIIECTTARLRLRQWQDTDLELFAKLNADPRVMEFFPAPLDHKASNALAERLRKLIAERGWGVWAVETVERTFIGFVGLHKPDDSLPFSPCVEVAWRLAFDYWHKGYATEAATAALSVGFSQLGLNEIVSFTSVLNLRSIAIMERLGMVRDPQTFQHPAVSNDSPLKEHVLYRLSRKQWQNQN